MKIARQKQIHATNATYERIDPLLSFLSFVIILFLDLPEGEGRKTALGEAPRHYCRLASALCPDLARGENRMSTSTDNNASQSRLLILTQLTPLRSLSTLNSRDSSIMDTG